MWQRKVSFSFILPLMMYLSFATMVFADDMEREPSLLNREELAYEEVEVSHDNTEAISYVYEYVGKPNGFVATSSPVISYYIKVMRDADYELTMLIDGVEVDANYDEKSGYMTYQANHLTGTHEVLIKLDVYGSSNVVSVWEFTVDPHPVQPFAGKDLSIISSVQKESIIRLNKYRSALNLPLFSANTSLHQAAQSHSNFLEENNITGHNQFRSGIGYTGTSPWDRAGYYGFTGSAVEGITYQKKTGSVGIDDLMDAPYHRLSIIDPHNSLAGIGYNNRGDIVVNYGSDTVTEKKPEIVLHPYDGQQDAKVSWFVAENPNPVRFWGIDREYVGYPITFAYFPVHSNNQLIVESLSLKDENNRDIPFYDVTPSRDSESINNVFLIPKSPLEPGKTYDVDVKASLREHTGNRIDVSRSWSFKTADAIDIEDIYFVNNSFLRVQLNSGDDPNAVISVEKDNRLYITREGNLQSNYRPITAGDYTLIIDSSLFNERKEVPITIKQNNEKRYDSDGDWDVLFSQSPEEIDVTPPIIEGIDAVTVKQNERFNPYENVTAFDDVDGDVTDQIFIDGTVDTTKVGTYEIIYSVRDKAGNETVETRIVTVEAVNLPKMPVVNQVTNASAFVTGRAEVGTTITMKVGQEVIGTATVLAAGTFQFPIRDQLPGTVLTFTATDEFGNVSAEKAVTLMDVLGDDDYFSWEPSQIVPVTKDWTITFNQKVDESTVNTDTIYVHYNQEKVAGIQLKISPDGKSVKVHAPENHYKKGKTYFLYIEDDIQSTKGKSLNKKIKLKFGT